MVAADNFFHCVNNVYGPRLLHTRAPSQRCIKLGSNVCSAGVLVVVSTFVSVAHIEACLPTSQQVIFHAWVRMRIKNATAHLPLSLQARLYAEFYWCVKREAEHNIEMFSLVTLLFAVKLYPQVASANVYLKIC